jgi:hypothetical protein
MGEVELLPSFAEPAHAFQGNGEIVVGNREIRPPTGWCRPTKARARKAPILRADFV